MSDLDPKLLKESGRASAIQDIADQAKAVADRAMALETAVADSLRAVLRRWRRAFFGLLAVSISVFAVGIINQVTLIEVQKTNKDVEALLEFVSLLVCEGESEDRFEVACARLRVNLED